MQAAGREKMKKVKKMKKMKKVIHVYWAYRSSRGQLLLDDAWNCMSLCGKRDVPQDYVTVNPKEATCQACSIRVKERAKEDRRRERELIAKEEKRR
jgi:hypothetical protein